MKGIFWGHTHEDELSVSISSESESKAVVADSYIPLQIFYKNNGTVQTAENALVVSWNGPSITPASNLNSGFRVYEVDSSVGFS